MGGLLPPVVLRDLYPPGECKAQVRFRATLMCPAGRLGVVISLPLVPRDGVVSVKGQV